MIHFFNDQKIINKKTIKAKNKKKINTFFEQIKYQNKNLTFLTTTIQHGKTIKTSPGQTFPQRSHFKNYLLPMMRKTFYLRAIL